MGERERNFESQWVQIKQRICIRLLVLQLVGGAKMLTINSPLSILKVLNNFKMPLVGS